MLAQRIEQKGYTGLKDKLRDSPVAKVAYRVERLCYIFVTLQIKFSLYYVVKSEGD